MDPTEKEQRGPKDELSDDVEEEDIIGSIADIQATNENDSSENSFKKFNYIFYFLYKYKYENDSRFGGSIPPELESN